MKTIIWHDSGKDICQQDTMVLYVKDTGTDDVTGLPTFKLGKARASDTNGQTALARAKGRYGGKGRFPLLFTINLSKVCELMGVPLTPELLNSPAQDPKFDDWVRARLPETWGSAAHMRGKLKTNDAGIEELVGHTPALNDQLVKVIAEIVGLAKRSPKPRFQLRDYQRPVAQKLLSVLIKHQLALMQCFGGYGKSATSLDLAVHLYKGQGYALMLSPVKMTIQDIITNSQQFKFGEKQLEVDVKELKSLTATSFLRWLARCETNNKVPVVTDTVQSVRGKDKASDEDLEELNDDERVKFEKELRKLDKRYAFLRAEPCFMLIRDETHLHYAAHQTSRVLAKLQPEFTLDMTATITARENMAFKYEEDAVITFGLIEALFAKEERTDDALMALPNLRLQACTHLDLSDVCIAELGAGANINGQKVFAFKAGRLLYPTTALEVLDMTFSLGAYGDGRRPVWKACTLDREIHQTGCAMLIVPRGDKEGNVKDKIDAIVKLMNITREAQAYFVSSYEFDHRLAVAPAHMTSIDIMETLRKEADGRKLVIVTHRKLLIGVNLPQLEGIALWDRIGSQALFMQVEFRLFRPYEDALNGRKVETRMVVYEPGVAIADSSALQAISAELRDGAQRTGRAVKEIEHLVGLSVYTSAGLRDVTHIEMEAAYQAQLFAKQQALFGVVSMSIVLDQLGEKGLEEVLAFPAQGKGGGGGGGDNEKTGVTDDNGARTFKPGQKTPAEGRESEAQQQNMLILCAMLEQLKLFSVHGGRGSLDSMEVARTPLMESCWGESNVKFLQGALEQGTLKNWADEHLRAKKLDFRDGGNLGPSNPLKGGSQQRIVLDNYIVMGLLWSKVKGHQQPKSILLINPKSALALLEAKRRYPLAEIHALVMDTTFNQNLLELGLTSKQIHLFREDNIITDMKFDIIIGNPPYLNGMHIKIIKSCLTILTDDGVCIMIHPSTPYIRPKNEGLRERLVELKLIDAKSIWPNVKLWVPLAVAVLKKNEQESFILVGHGRVSAAAELTPFGLVPAVEGIKKKLSAGLTLKEKATRGNADGPFIVMVSGIAGNAQARDMYFLLPQRAELETHVKTVPGRWHNFSFETHAEALNFTRYLTSKLAMAGCATNKINQNLGNFELSTIPWLDFTKHWTDDALYEHFNLTKEEIAWVEALPTHPRRGDTI